MNTAHWILIVVCALGAAGALDAPDALAQKSFRGAAEGSYPPRHAAAFPGETKQSLRQSKTPSGQAVSTHLRELKSGDRYYGTAWTPVPGAPASPAEQARLLELAAAAALKTEPGAILVSRQDISLTGIAGLAYVIDLPQSNTRMRQQIFMVTGVLVEQTYTGPAGTETRREANRFFDSLRLVP